MVDAHMLIFDPRNSPKMEKTLRQRGVVAIQRNRGTVRKKGTLWPDGDVTCMGRFSIVYIIIDCTPSSSLVP